MRGLFMLIAITDNPEKSLQSTRSYIESRLVYFRQLNWVMKDFLPDQTKQITSSVVTEMRSGKKRYSMAG